MQKISRVQTPPLLGDYRQYKSFLRIDFRWRCCYCGVRERKWGGATHFAVEHFKPKSAFPELETVYSNLYYACDGCNCYKWRHWPTPSDLASGRRFFDICSDVPREHFWLDREGDLNHVSACGAYTIKLIRLNRTILVQIRREYLALLRQFKQSVRAVRGLRMLSATCQEIEKKKLIEQTIAVLESNLQRIRDYCTDGPLD